MEGEAGEEERPHLPLVSPADRVRRNAAAEASWKVYCGCLWVDTLRAPSKHIEKIVSMCFALTIVGKDNAGKIPSFEAL